jgi:preprotein translocase subunit SecA
MITSLRHGVFTELFRTHVPEESLDEQWDIQGLETALANEWQLGVPLSTMLVAEPNLTDEELLERVLKASDESYQAKIELVGKEAFGGFERSVMLQNIDSHWREHLAALDHLRQGIHLRGYAQKNPKQEYKREAFELFGQMLDMIRDSVIRIVATVRIQSREEMEAAEQSMAQSHVENVNYQHAEFDENAAPEDLLAPTANAEASKQQPIVNSVPKVGRNDACPCGSGKKYKQCHGRLA